MNESMFFIPNNQSGFNERIVLSQFKKRLDFES